MLFEAGASQPGGMMSESIEDNNIEVVEVLISCGIDVNAVDAEGRTYLHQCANGTYKRSWSEITRMLLSAAADPNILDLYGRNAICYVMCQGDLETFKLLLPVSDVNVVDNFGEMALHNIAPSPGNPAAVQYFSMLKEKGVDLEAPNGDNDTAFGVSAWYGDLDYLEALLGLGCNINATSSEDGTALALVAGMDLDDEDMLARRAAVCKFLIREGTDIDLAGPTGITPVMNAVKSAHFTILRQLLQANCRANVPWLIDDDQVTKFMAGAITNGATDCATFIFGDSCPSTEEQLSFIDLSLQPEALVSGRSIGLPRPPVSLFRLCRLRVRSLLPKGPAFLKTVDRLEIPSHIKDFVALRSMQTK